MAPAGSDRGDDKRYSRVVFNEITKNAIRQAFEKPGELNIDRVNAQQARRFMDRVVGYMVSPLLWKKVARGLSAGVCSLLLFVLLLSVNARSKRSSRKSSGKWMRMSPRRAAMRCRCR